LGASSCEHPNYPVDPTGKIVRANIKAAHYIFESLDDGKRCRFHYLTEFDFGGSVPRSLVQMAAADKTIQAL
jgi:hypothetical protein